MKVLAVETATEACSVALYVNGAVIDRYQLAPRAHSRLILPMMQSLLDEAGVALADLDALAFGCGPGSFTGIRIAAGVTQGAALGADLPITPISTLAALAQECFVDAEAEYAFPALDARMGDVYWGVYHKTASGFAERKGQEAAVPADGVDVPLEATGIGIGSGWRVYSEALKKRLGQRLVRVAAERYPSAAFVARLAAEGLKNNPGLPADLALPVYLRDTVARKMSD